MNSISRRMVMPKTKNRWAEHTHPPIPSVSKNRYSILFDGSSSVSFSSKKLPGVPGVSFWITFSISSVRTGDSNGEFSFKGSKEWLRRWRLARPQAG